MPLIATRGAASVQGFGEFAQTAAPVYIEDVFSTYLYTGNSSTQTITNGIDLSTKGGLVWTKNRTGSSATHQFIDTVRGKNSALASQNTDSALGASDITSFNATGFSLGYITGNSNFNNDTYASWTFREQPKFFDVVTYTGDGTAGRTIAHNLGSTPGCIIVKKTSGADAWAVYHRSAAKSGYTAQESYLILNSTQQVEGPYSGYWNNTAPTSTVFTLGNDGWVNGNGATYVAYLFAHDAGGFGLTGSDNVITCGSYTGTGSAQTLSLGYEPQWVLIKQSSGANDWNIWDNMRGLVVGGTDAYLQPNTSNAENSLGAYDFLSPTATGLTIDPTSAGFNYVNTNGQTYIYIAIRRGPMKTPTTGTSVFSPLLTTNSTGATNTTGFPVDLQLWTLTGGYQTTAQDRLRGVSTTSTQTSCPELLVPYTNAESSNAFQVRNWNNTGFETPSAVSGSSTIWWNFRRAPGFFDEVCYTANSVNGRTINHNLTVAPEFTIFKSRSATSQWYIWHNSFTLSQEIYFNTSAIQSGGIFTSAPTSSAIFASSGNINFSGFGNVVAYLFASVAGVSKVGSYTGTGALQTVNCGFTGGARFVLIKRTDSTGDWWVYDSARGISSGNDPYILINVPGVAQVTGTNYVDTTSVGFQVTAAAPAGLNANGGTYIFLAIA